MKPYQIKTTMTLLNLSVSEMELKANFYRNELGYLLPSIESEKKQAREYVGKLTNLIENMEMANVRQSLIDACINCVQGSLKKFS